MDLVVSGELINKLSLPTISEGASTEGTGFSGKSRGEDTTVDLQLVGVIGVEGCVNETRGPNLLITETVSLDEASWDCERGTVTNLDFNCPVQVKDVIDRVVVVTHCAYRTYSQESVS